MVDRHDTDTKYDLALRDGVILPEQLVEQQRRGIGTRRWLPADDDGLRRGEQIACQRAAHGTWHMAPRPRHFWEHAAGGNPRYQHLQQQQQQQQQPPKARNPFELTSNPLHMASLIRTSPLEVSAALHASYLAKSTPAVPHGGASPGGSASASTPMASRPALEGEPEAPEDKPSPPYSSSPPSHRSLAAMTVTVFGGDPESDRSLGGFSVVME
jgi:hypothetical protein